MMQSQQAQSHSDHQRRKAGLLYDKWASVLVSPVCERGMRWLYRKPCMMHGTRPKPDGLLKGGCCDPKREVASWELRSWGILPWAWSHDAGNNNSKDLLWSSRKTTLLLFNYFHHFFCLEKATETCPWRRFKMSFCYQMLRLRGKPWICHILHVK